MSKYIVIKYGKTNYKKNPDEDEIACLVSDAESEKVKEFITRILN